MWQFFGNCRRSRVHWEAGPLILVLKTPPNVLAIRREFEIRFGRFLDAGGPTFSHYRISLWEILKFYLKTAMLALR